MAFIPLINLAIYFNLRVYYWKLLYALTQELFMEKTHPKVTPYTFDLCQWMTKLMMTLFSMSVTVVVQAQSQWEIDNSLNLNWPGELVHFDAKGAPDSRTSSIDVDGRITPVQIEHLEDTTRYWSYVSVPRKKEGKSSAIARLSSQPAEKGIHLDKDGDCYLIDNGVYQFRLRRFTGTLENPIPLSDLPHWIGGMRTRGIQAWDGRAWFDSNETVVAAKTELIANGPVFVDFRVTIEFADSETGETVEALPLALGKQSHLWEPNKFPSETIAKLKRSYEVLLRFTMNNTDSK